MSYNRVTFAFFMFVLVLLAACQTAIGADGILGALFDPFGIFHHTGGRTHHFHRRATVRSSVNGHREHTVAKATAVTSAAHRDDYWPQAFDDLFGFVFWTSGRNEFWNHGYADILNGIFSLRQAGAPAKRPPDQTTAQDTDANHRPENCKASTAWSGPADVGSEDAVFRYIDERIASDKMPNGVFDEFRDSLLKAEERVAPGCSDAAVAATSPERLRSIGDRLWRLRQAVLIVRMPLEKVYDALPSQQRVRIDGVDLAAIKCAKVGSETLSWPRDEIQQTIHPTLEQRAGLERLRMIALQMAQWLSMSCPQQPPATALERLDAAGDRLNAMLYAARITGLALRNFYGSLEEEQKVNFQAIGRRQLDASRAANQR